MRSKFLIVAPEYNETNGGIVVLHKLCDLLNSVGFDAYIYPYTISRICPPYSRLRNIWDGLQDDIKLMKHRLGKRFITNPHFNTPILRKFNHKNNDDWIVIYPETTTGNPLRATNVVRWLLHHPGYFSKVVSYGRGELYFCYGTGTKYFHIHGSRTADNLLKIIHYPVEHYNTNDLPTIRDGIAYCVRKGKGRSLNNVPEGAVNIDGLDHKETANILKNSKLFISYDQYTAYSKFALMCGCDSMVVPIAGIQEEQWYKDIEDRYGIAYGADRLEWSRETAHLQLERIRNLEMISKNITIDFANEAIDYFSNPRDFGYQSHRNKNGSI